MFVVILLWFLPHLPCPSGASQAVTLLAVPPTYVRAATCVLYPTSYFLSYSNTTVLLSFASLRYVSQQRRFVPSLSISVGYSPPAANNFCVPFGLLRLRVCHTFCRSKKKQKVTPNPCMIRCCPMPYGLSWAAP